MNHLLNLSTEEYPPFIPTPELIKALRLEKTLYHKTGATKRTDILRDYRVWLDNNEINSEEEGWPSKEAYSESVINEFVKNWRG